MMTLPESWVSRIGEVVLQITLWSSIGITLLLLLRTRSPLLRKRLLLGASAGLLLLTALVLVPPAWSLAGWLRSIDVAEAPSFTSQVTVTVEDAPASTGRFGVWFKSLFGQMQANHPVATLSNEAAAWDWPSLLLIVLAATSGWFLLRFVRALCHLRRYRRLSQPASSERVIQLAAELMKAMRINRKVDIRESAVLAGPATLGWRRSLILLPISWHGWSDDELRCVLAHELAHVGSGDFLTNLVLQFLRALHGYHPLVHVLVRQAQNLLEVLADARAAEQVGRPCYVKSLCQLALRPTPGKVRPPALAFLSPMPLSRRMTMLSQTPGRTTWAAGLALSGAMLVSLALIAGLRSPAAAEDPIPGPLLVGRDAQVSSPSKFDFRFLPKNADGVFVVRPALALSLPGLASKAEVADGFMQDVFQQFLLRRLPSLSLRHIDQAVGTLRLKVKTKEEMGQVEQAVHLIRLKDGMTWEQLLARDWPELKPVHHAGKPLYQTPAEVRRLPIFDGPSDLAAALPDPQTMIVGSEAELKTILDGTYQAQRVLWKPEDLNHFANAWAFVGFDLTRGRDRIDKSKDRVTADLLKKYEAVWRRADYGLMGFMAEPKAVMKFLVANSGRPLQVDSTFQAGMEAVYGDVVKSLPLSDDAKSKVSLPVRNGTTSPFMTLSTSQLIYQSPAAVSYGELLQAFTAESPADATVQFECETVIFKVSKPALQALRERFRPKANGTGAWELAAGDGPRVAEFLKTQAGVKVLARPILRTLDNRTGSIAIGTDIRLTQVHHLDATTRKVVSRMDMEGTGGGAVTFPEGESCSWLIFKSDPGEESHLVMATVRCVAK